MGFLSGYINQNLADKHGVCGENDKGIFWEYGIYRYYFRDRNARRWYARATVNEALKALHQNSQPISKERIGEK